MREHRPALRMRDIDGRLGDGRVHVDDGLVAHEHAGEQLDAVLAHHQASRAPISPPSSGVAASGSCNSAGRYAGCPPLGEIRCRPAECWDRRSSPAAMRLRSGNEISRIGPEIPDRGEAPARQHVLHVLRQAARPARSPALCRTRFREMHVAVPEPGHHGLAAAIDDARIRGHLRRRPDVPTALMTPSVMHDHRIGQRRRIGRRVERAADEHLRSSACAAV